jgi:hypothetical protein
LRLADNTEGEVGNHAPAQFEKLMGHSHHSRGRAALN